MAPELNHLSPPLLLLSSGRRKNWREAKKNLFYSQIEHEDKKIKQFAAPSFFKNFSLK
jgi:hypothetical protein